MATNPTITLPTINMGANPLLPAGPGTTTPRTPFFNPTPISRGQYMSGPVDFYSQTLDTTGIGVTSTPGLDEEDKEEESGTSNLSGPDGQGDNPPSILETSFGGGLKNLNEVVNFGVQDINFGPDSNNTYNFTNVPEMTMDPATGRVARDLNSSWSDSLFDYAENTLFEGAKAGFQATRSQVMGIGEDGKPAKDRSITDKITDLLGTPQVGARPFGTKSATVSPGGGIGMAAGMGISALATAFGGMNLANQARNAAAYRATGGTGGAIMEVGGQMVSRMPGASTFPGEFGGKVDSFLGELTDPISGVALNRNYLGGMHFVYSGNMRGLSNFQMSAREAASRGFVPGTMIEVYDPVTKSYKRSSSMVGKDGKILKNYISANDMQSTVGGTYNPKTGTFIDLNGNSSAVGTEKAAIAYVAGLNSRFGSTLPSSAVARGRATARARGINFVDQMEEDAIKSGMSVTGLSFAQLNSMKSGNFIVSGTGGRESGLNEKGFSTFSDFRGDSETADNAPGISPEDVMSAEVQAQVNAAMAAQYNDDPGGDNPGGQSVSSEEAGLGAGGGFGLSHAKGGRVGMQMGGAAMEQPAGFVERPPSQVSDGQTVADDVPATVGEGSFVINAPAVEFAGEADIRKLLDDAYAKVAQRGVAAPSQEQIDIAVSRGEVIIPPEVAKEIGYDKLNKINNRGKKEVSRRQAERQGKSAAGGGFISRKKFKEGGMPLPKSKPKRVNKSGLADVEFRADLEEFIQNDPLARLGFNLYEKGDVEIKAIVVPARRKVGIGIAGVYTPKQHRRDPGFISRDFERRAARQGLSNKDSSVAGIHYFEGQNVNYGRAEGKITLLHELRHHAMRHLNKKYKVPMPTIGREETLMDVQDHANRKQARKVKPSIPENPREKDLEVRQRGAYMSPSANRELAMYQEIAKEVLKDRKVPPRTKSKEVEGFFDRAMGLLGL